MRSELVPDVKLLEEEVEVIRCAHRGYGVIPAGTGSSPSGESCS